MNGCTYTEPRLPPHICPDGPRRTTIARTLVDLAREHGFAEAVVAGDAALRGNLVTRNEIARVLNDCRGWPYTRRAGAMLDFIDPRSESVLESLSRIKIRDHDLPSPELQAVIRDPYGRFVARCDFLFEFPGGQYVVGEADGLGKYDQRGVEEHEQVRRQRIENLGLGFVRWQKRDLRTFGVIADRIRHTIRHLPPCSARVVVVELSLRACGGR